MNGTQSPRGPRIIKLGRSESRESASNVVRLRRSDTSHPWGFRMMGGIDQDSCLYINKVNPRCIAERSGLRLGDGIQYIAGVPTTGMTHDQAKMEILRAGNELDLYVERNAVHVQSETVQRQLSREDRAEIIDDPSEISTGYQNPNIQSRSFKIIQEALNYTEANSVPSEWNIPGVQLVSMRDVLNL